MAFNLFKPFLWFNSKERAELEKLRKENTRLEEVNKELILKAFSNIVPNEKIKPFKSLRYIGGEIVTVLNDGLVLSKIGTKEEFTKCSQLRTEDEVIEFFVDEQVQIQAKQKEYGVNSQKVIVETPEEKQIINDNLRVLRGHPDFEIDGTDVYLTRVKLPMPALVTGSFIELLEKLEIVNNSPYPNGGDESMELEEQYQALKFFWLKLALNPIPQSRQDLLGFVKRNDVRITKNGNLILYRRVVSKNERADKKVIAAISQFYAKVKKNKKSPKNFNLLEDLKGNYSVSGNNKAAGEMLTGSKLVGNLYDLYQNLSSMQGNTYSAAHRGTSIKIGGIYSIPDDEIDLNNGVCASGGLDKCGLLLGN